MSELQALVEEIERDFGVRICVHDISGITFIASALELPYLWKTHGGWYCSRVKEAVSERDCIHQKAIALHKLKRNGEKPYCGMCSMGVCDYVEPVKMDGKLLAVIFASGMIAGRETEAREKLLRHLEKRGAAPEGLPEELARFAKSAAATEKQLRFFAELVRNFILKAARENNASVQQPAEPYPVESLRTWHPGRAAMLVSYLKANYKNRITMDMLSRQFLISEGHINRLIRDEIHMGPIAYVKELRLEAAARELRETKYSVREIGERVGIPDVNYLCRCFKARFGMTPTEYRTAAHASPER